MTAKNLISHESHILGTEKRESLNVTLIKSLHQRRDRFIEHPESEADMHFCSAYSITDILLSDSQFSITAGLQRSHFR